MYTQLYPTFIYMYSKTGVCRGIPIFLTFALKHRLWALVTLEPPRRCGSNVFLQSTLSKNKKNKKKNLLFFFSFTTLKISVYCMDMLS